MTGKAGVPPAASFIFDTIDGHMAEKSVERKYAESLEGADEVCVYVKLPKGSFYHIYYKKSSCGKNKEKIEKHGK